MLDVPKEEHDTVSEQCIDPLLPMGTILASLKAGTGHQHTSQFRREICGKAYPKPFEHPAL